MKAKEKPFWSSKYVFETLKKQLQIDLAAVFAGEDPKRYRRAIPALWHYLGLPGKPKTKTFEERKDTWLMILQKMTGIQKGQA